MSYKMVKAILQVPGEEFEKPINKFVLVSLATYANKDAECWPSHATLAKDCGCSRRTVIYALKALQDMHTIVRIRRSDTSNIYRIIGTKPMRDERKGGAKSARGMCKLRQGEVQNLHMGGADNDKTGVQDLHTNISLRKQNNEQTNEQIIEGCAAAPEDPRRTRQEPQKETQNLSPETRRMRVEDLENQWIKSESLIEVYEKAEKGASKGNVSSFSKAYRMLVAKIFSGFQPALTLKQFGQLKLFRNKVIETGHDPFPVMAACVIHWDGFCTAVHVATGENVPIKPVTGFLLANVNAAIEYANRNPAAEYVYRQPVTVDAYVPMPLTNTPETPQNLTNEADEEDDPPVTLEELLAGRDRHGRGNTD